MAWLWDLWRSNALLALAIVLFLGGLGVPGPATIAIVAMGALVRGGHVSPWTALSVGLCCAATGDFVSYAIARRGLGRWMEKRRRKPAWKKAVSRFEKNAMLSLFLARWLLTPISLPTTYIAGSSRYPIARYLAASIAGQFVWVTLYGGIGYELGRHWQSRAGGLLWVVAGALAVVATLVATVWIARRRKPLPPVPQDHP